MSFVLSDENKLGFVTTEEHRRRVNVKAQLHNSGSHVPSYLSCTCSPGFPDLKWSSRQGTKCTILNRKEKQNKN